MSKAAWVEYERRNWEDTGCNVSPRCQDCPLPVCKHDVHGGVPRILATIRKAAEKRERIHRTGIEAAKAQAIARQVAREGGLGIGALIQAFRASPEVIAVRHRAIVEVRRGTSLNVTQIAWLFRRDHASIVHVLRKVGLHKRRDALAAARLDGRAEVAA